MAEEEKKQQPDVTEQTEAKPEKPVEADASTAEEESAEEKAAPDEKSSETAEEQPAVEAKTSDTDAKVASLTEQLMRLRADFDNYKKRSAREKADIAAYTTEGLLKKLLPVIDNLERAQSAAEKSDGEDDTQFVEGVNMVFKELMNVLEDEGLKEIDALGKKFDPNYHHGVAVANDPEQDDQVVLSVFQKGYMYKDKVIRAAMVQINQK